MASQNVSTTYIKQQTQTADPSSVAPSGSGKVTVTDTFLEILPTQLG